MAEQLCTYTGCQTKVATRAFERRGIAVAYLQIEFRAAIYYRCYLFLKATQTCILETYVQRYLDIVNHNVFISISEPRPHWLLTEIDTGSLLVVYQPEVDTYTDTGEHHFSLNTGYLAHLLLNVYEVLLKDKVVECYTHNGAIAKLGITLHRQSEQRR